MILDPAPAAPASEALTLLIPISAVIAIAFAAFLWRRVSQIRVGGSRASNGREYLLEEEQRGEGEVRNRFPEASGFRRPRRAAVSRARRTRREP